MARRKAKSLRKDRQPRRFIKKHKRKDWADKLFEKLKAAENNDGN